MIFLRHQLRNIPEPDRRQCLAFLAAVLRDSDFPTIYDECPETGAVLKNEPDIEKVAKGAEGMVLELDARRKREGDTK